MLHAHAPAAGTTARATRRQEHTRTRATRLPKGCDWKVSWNAIPTAEEQIRDVRKPPQQAWGLGLHNTAQAAAATAYIQLCPSATVYTPAARSPYRTETPKRAEAVQSRWTSRVDWGGLHLRPPQQRQAELFPHTTGRRNPGTPTGGARPVAPHRPCHPVVSSRGSLHRGP